MTTSALLFVKTARTFIGHKGHLHDLVLMKAKDDSTGLFFFSVDSLGMNLLFRVCVHSMVALFCDKALATSNDGKDLWQMTFLSLP